MIQKGPFWENVVQRSETARRLGALQPMQTTHCFLEAGGVRYLVHRLVGRPLKEQARQQQAAAQARGEEANPFLPYDPALWVADLSPTHVCLLNKFNVIDHHLLVVTRRFEEQTAALNLADFQALWLVMAQVQGLGFYNAGEMAGASQRHKHLQVAPYPLAPGVLEPPTAVLIEQAPLGGPVTQSPALPFAHGVVYWESDLATRPQEAAAASYAAYVRLLKALGLAGPQPLDGQILPPYNLLLTRRWMFLAPRSRSSYASISINGLGFAGSFFVRDEEQFDRLKRIGPLAVLQHVVEPAGAPFSR